MMSQWGMWLVIGLVLLVIEVSVPAFVALFFGLSALLVALLCFLAGPGLQPWLARVIFSGLSLALLLALRGFFKKMFVGKQSVDHANLSSDILGQRAVVVARIHPGQPGKVELRGANWQAESSEILDPGTQVRVIKQESILLTVERM